MSGGRKTGALWQVAVETSPEGEDAVMELLARVTGRAAVGYTDAETKATTVSVYCEARAEWTAARRAELAGGIAAARKAGLRLGAGRIRARKVAREDWAESWKRHFRPIEISGRLLVKPGWSRRRAKAGQAVVVLDPGLSFGTGNHPTTAFCLRELAAARRDGARQAFLDIGTGSGILAIAAAKLGYAPVIAVDVDAEAVRIARENARRNGVSGRVKIGRGDLTRMARGGVKYDVICANLMADLLVAERGRIVGRLRAGGRLVLAGILRREFARVRRAYERGGLRWLRSADGGEWRSGVAEGRLPKGRRRPRRKGCGRRGV